jgi:hypothetical protein
LPLRMRLLGFDADEKIHRLYMRIEHLPQAHALLRRPGVGKLSPNYADREVPGHPLTVDTQLKTAEALRKGVSESGKCSMPSVNAPSHAR